ncbi:MAG TPA: hypothetical protein VMH47_04270 [Gaiellaceae bacterium]|nr:hypothetical protein [Gaiellaceae bacterium]
MSFFLLTYRRQADADPAIVRFEDSTEAMSAFVNAERALRDDETQGVVLLVAEDEQTLRRTHSHYFSTFDELLAEAT